MDDQRLIALETKASHQELAIEQLQQAVYEQQQEIQRLHGLLRQQMQRLEVLSGDGPDIGPADERPPHY